MKNVDKSKNELIKENTQLKKRIEQLEIMESKFRKMVQTIPDIIYELNEEGNFVFVSDVIKLLGYKPEEIIGKHFKVILHPEDYNLVSREMVLPKYKGRKTGNFESPKLFDERRSGKRTTRNLIVRIASKGSIVDKSDYRLAEIYSSGVWSILMNQDDNSIKYYYTEIYSTGKWNSKKIKDNNKFIGTIGVIRDITIRKKMENELLNVMKFEALSILSNRISHDFNNILTGILNNLTIAEDKMTDSHILSILKSIKNNTLRARKLVHQLSTFSYNNKISKSVIDIKKLVKDVVDFTLSGSNIKCIYKFDNVIYNVEIDPDQISQVITNLVINAIQSIEINKKDKGKIEVYIKNAKNNDLRSLPIKDGKYIKIIIKDNGKGIPEDILQKIYDPYFTTKENGTGLGLSTCYAILRNHNGYIDVDSKINRGTAFSIYLKACLVENIKEINQKKENKKMKKLGRILLIDDEQIILQATSKMLVNLGYEPEIINNYMDAINIYKESYENNMPFDAIIMDLVIPGQINALDTIRLIKDIDEKVNIILSTGYTDDPVVLNYKKFGIRAIINKPYGIKDLDIVLKEVICK